MKNTENDIVCVLQEDACAHPTKFYFLASQIPLANIQLSHPRHLQREHVLSHHLLSEDLPISERQRAQRRRRKNERVHHMTIASETGNLGQLSLATHSYTEPIQPICFGQMNVECLHCHALHWLDERVKQSDKSSPIFSQCCHHGKVQLDPLPEPPVHLQTLFTADSDDAKEFRERIRQYNSALTFTSFTANEEDVNRGGKGPWIWKLGYTIYHRASSLIPNSVNNPKYAQLYFYDPEEALQIRMNRNTRLNSETMFYLQNTLLDINRFVDLYFHSLEILDRMPSIDLQIRILADPSNDNHRYNTPSVNELAVVMPGDLSHALDPRDIVLHRRDGDLHFIHDHHPAYAPLHYVLLFPYSTPGWTYGIELHSSKDDVENDDNESSHHKQTTVSQAMWYGYRLHCRAQEFSTIHCGGRLFQQYLCDMWVSTDQSRLRWVETHQKNLRASLYSGLEDAVGHGESDVDLHDLGHRVVLPSSYVGGPRYMNQRFQDVIALARHFHSFDLFITFTCNPSWPEVKNALLDGQTASDRPDITSCVFNMYKTSLIDEISKDDIFGPTLGHVYTIEFQKRGLPHMHMLLTLSAERQISSPEDVDLIIRATWPDPVTEPRLFDIVKRNMVHGPCGRWKQDAPCMRDGKCSKGFPKPFQSETIMTKNGYPIYARPEDGHEYNVRGFLADNRWIIPYNPYILSWYSLYFLYCVFTQFTMLNLFSYNAHINVECVMSLQAAKYITKYTHKGPDRATVELRRRDEVAQFKDCRYIAASEACWRLLEFPIHHQVPPVMSLQVHLPGQHMTTFDPDESPEVVTARGERETSMLTAFFELNLTHSSARQYTYQEIPLHFVWDRGKKIWKPRQRQPTIGRVYFVSPNAGERFYLRTLLISVKGPTSWHDLRTFNGIEYPTFHASCLARGLLENDDEWRECLQEASLSHLGESLRRLFALILRHCQPSEPDVLWMQFRDNLCDDLERRLQRRNPSLTDISSHTIHDFGLFLIDQELRLHGQSLSAFPSMPIPKHNWDFQVDNVYIVDQLSYDADKEQQLFDDNYQLLNSDQLNAFHHVVDSTTNEIGQIFFLHGAGGTGKTFVYQTICHYIRAKGWIVLCVASSGIASLLLPGGHMAHSTFSIPVLNIHESSSCSVEKNSKQADMFRAVRLIIWDEAVTQHR